MTDEFDMGEVTDLVEGISTEARKTFSLQERLENRGMREDTIVLYTDDEHAYAHSAVAAKIEEARKAGNEDAVAQLEEKLEQLAELTKESAVTITLQAVPTIVLKDIKRKARRAFVKKGPIPDEKLEDFLDVYNHYVVGACIRRVVDAEGAVDETNYMDHNNVKRLEDFLPMSQWDKLWNKVEDLQFADKIGLLSVSNPDF